MEIAFDNCSFKKMYINFPKYNCLHIKSLVDRANLSKVQNSTLPSETQIRKLKLIEHEFMSVLDPLFEDEQAFYE